MVIDGIVGLGPASPTDSSEHVGEHGWPTLSAFVQCILRTVHKINGTRLTDLVGLGPMFPTDIP